MNHNLFFCSDYLNEIFGFDATSNLIQFFLAKLTDFSFKFDERWRQSKSIAISAQLPVKDWPAAFKDQTIADAIMDRVVRNAHRINLKGPSRRPSLEHTPSDDDISDAE